MIVCFRKFVLEGCVTDAAFAENVRPGMSSPLVLLQGHVEMLQSQALSAFPVTIRALKNWVFIMCFMGIVVSVTQKTRGWETYYSINNLIGGFWDLSCLVPAGIWNDFKKYALQKKEKEERNYKDEEGKM